MSAQAGGSADALCSLLLYGSEVKFNVTLIFYKGGRGKAFLGLAAGVHILILLLSNCLIQGRQLLA